LSLARVTDDADALQLQITEVVATLASLDSTLSDMSYFKFTANYFELLLAEGRLWEAVRMLSISSHRATLDNVDFPTVCGKIRELYDALMSQLDDSGSLESSSGSAGRQSENLCSLSATASLMQLMLITKSNSADFRLAHDLLGSLLQEVFDTLSDSKPRGGYAELWTTCDHYLQKMSVPTTTSLDVLTSLDLKDARGNNLVGNVREAFKKARTELSRLPNSQNLLYQFEKPYRRVRNWYNTLSAFGGSEEQGNQIISRRSAIRAAVEEVFTIANRIADTTDRRAPLDISDLDQSVAILINMTPVASLQYLGSLDLKNAELPQSPLSASRAKPRRNTTVSSDPRYLHRIGKVMFNDYARTIVGDRDREGRGNSYSNIIARGHSMMIAGNLYGGPSVYPGEQPGVEGTSPQISERPSTVSESGEATSKMPGDF